MSVPGNVLGFASGAQTSPGSTMYTTTPVGSDTVGVSLACTLYVFNKNVRI